MLGTYRKEAMFSMPKVSTMDRVDSLPLLCLLPTTIKPSLSSSKLVLQAKL